MAAHTEDEFLSLQYGAITQGNTVFVNEASVADIRKYCHTLLLQVTLQMLFLVNPRDDIPRS